MAFCPKCGREVEQDTRFCPACGASLNTEGEQPKTDFSQKASDTFKKAEDWVNQTSDYTAHYDPDDIQKNKGMAILSYISILVLIPIFAAKDSKFARFHANQGLILFVAEIVLGIVCAALGFIPVVGWIVNAVVYLVEVAYMILGIVYAAQGKAKDLPIIGQYKLLS